MKRLVSFILIVAAVGLGIWGYFYAQARGNAPKFRTARVERGPLTAAISATGNLNAVITVQVGSQVSGQIKELQGYEVIRREVRYDERCRIDLLLRRDGRPDCFVEVKNVHLKRIAGAEFPDAVTVRGAKHLGALTRQVAQGARAVVMYVVQRTDCVDFRIAADIDPIYAASFAAALDGGVEALCYACEVSLEDVRLSAPLPILLS